MRALSIADRERASVDSAVEAVEQKRLEPLEAVEEVVRSPGSARSERTIALPACPSSGALLRLDTLPSLDARLDQRRRHLRAALVASSVERRTSLAVSKLGVGAVVEELRRAGKRVVFTNGCFDVLHAGHVNYLRFARSKGDALIVGVNDDASVTRLKGPSRPVNGIDDRMEVLAALEVVDAVVPFHEDTPKELVEQVSPDVLVKGEDYKDKVVVGAEWVEAHGGQVVLAPLLEGRSTTGILERASGDSGGAPGAS